MTIAMTIANYLCLVVQKLCCVEIYIMLVKNVYVENLTTQWNENPTIDILVNVISKN